MLKNLLSKYSFIITLVLVTFTHILILYVFKFYSGDDWSSFQGLHNSFFNRLKIDQIKVITKDELDKVKRSGIRGGSTDKNLMDAPDFKIPPHSPPGGQLNIQNLGLNNPVTPPSTMSPQNQKTNSLKNTPSLLDRINDKGVFEEIKKPVVQVNRLNTSQKMDIIKNTRIDPRIAQSANLSNWDLKIVRPEGVSEEQMSSLDSFGQRAYQNLYNKFYFQYNKSVLEDPKLELDMYNKHVLVGRVEYDGSGNIVSIKILKSSESDHVHLFFEELLKQLTLFNPPKLLVKNNSFTVYYQININ